MNEDSEKPNESKKERSRKRQRENSSKTDDESTDATFMEDQQNEDGTMNEETYDERLNEINMKLDKLLSLSPLVEDLNVQFAPLKEENTQLRKSLQWATDEAKDLRKIQTEMKTELDNMKAKLLTVDQQLQKQTTRNIKIEAQSRRSNVKFFNVKETEATDNSYETEKVLKQLLINEHKMTEEVVDKLQFERVHRIPTKRSSKTPIDKPRPIIAKLSFYKDKTSIFQHVKNI